MRLTKTVSFKHRWLGTIVLVSIAIIAISLIILESTSNARQQVNALMAEPPDHKLATLLRVEAQVVDFQHDLLRAQVDPAGFLADTRQSYFALRRSVEQITTHPDYLSLRDISAFGVSLSALDRELHGIEPAFRAKDSVLSASIAGLLPRVEQMQTSALSLREEGINAILAVDTKRRESVAKALFDLSFIVGLIFAILTVSVVVLLLSLRAAARQAMEITATRNRLNATISTSFDAVLVTDGDGRILDFNGSASRIFGYRSEEILGSDLAQLLMTDQSGDQAFSLAKSLEDRASERGLLRLDAQTNAGRRIPVELSVSSTQGDAEKVFVFFIRDISDRIDAETELVKARDRAVAGEKAKANLLAVMSHEIRTPLNGLLGSLQLLNRTKLSKRQTRLLNVMQTTGQMLIEHVNNVLDISRADAGKVEIAQRTFNLAQMIEDLVTSLNNQAKTRGNTLGFELIGDKVANTVGDKSRVSQILVNLIGNAIKFTENGVINVEVEREANSDFVVFRVTDNGIGIPAENQEKIFNDFETLDASFHRSVEGTGLGLGIVKRLVKLLNGEIGMESDAGVGSVFWVRLPLPDVASEIVDEEQSKQAESTKAPFQGHAVLLVEDNEINRMVAREILTSFGCHIIEAQDGLDGVAKASADRFDLIFCDISMPEIDGLETTRRIRTQSGPNQNTPIVALTAHALPGDVETFLAAGMSDVVVKPLTFKELGRVLTTHSAGSATSKLDRAGSGANPPLDEQQMRRLRSRAAAELHNGLAALKSTQTSREDRQKTAHEMSGVAAVMGYSKLHSKLSEIEYAAQNDSPHHLSELIQATEKLLPIQSPNSMQEGRL